MFEAYTFNQHWTDKHHLQHVELAKILYINANKTLLYPKTVVFSGILYCQ